MDKKLDLSFVGGKPLDLSEDEIKEDIAHRIERAETFLASDILVIARSGRVPTWCVGTLRQEIFSIVLYAVSLFDLDLPNVTFEPVITHNGIKIARGNFSFPVGDNAQQADKAFGDWMEDNFFIVQKSSFRSEDVELPGYGLGASMGEATGSTPVSGSTTWTGVMVGVDLERGNAILGDAEREVDFEAADLGLVAATTLGFHPLMALLLVVPGMAVFGYALQRGILNHTLGHDILPPLLVTFGLSIILQNGLLEIFTADPQKMNAGYLEIASLPVGGGLNIGIFPLLVLLTAVALIAGLQWVFYRTALGRAFRATSDNHEIAQLVGLNKGNVFGLAMALSLAVVAVAGVFLGIRTSFDPASGPGRLIFGFEAVIIGGLGNLWGTLAGGIILGVSQNIGAKINPGWQILAEHVGFLIVLAVRPRSLFPRIDDER